MKAPSITARRFYTAFYRWALLQQTVTHRSFHQSCRQAQAQVQLRQVRSEKPRAADRARAIPGRRPPTTPTSIPQQWLTAPVLTSLDRAFTDLSAWEEVVRYRSGAGIMLQIAVPAERAGILRQDYGEDLRRLTRAHGARVEFAGTSSRGDESLEGVLFSGTFEEAARVREAVLGRRREVQQSMGDAYRRPEIQARTDRAAQIAQPVDNGEEAAPWPMDDEMEHDSEGRATIGQALQQPNGTQQPWFDNPPRSVSERPSRTILPWSFALRSKSSERADFCTIEFLVPERMWQRITADKQDAAQLCDPYGTEIQIGESLPARPGVGSLRQIFISGPANGVNETRSQIIVYRNQIRRGDGASHGLVRCNVSIPHHSTVLPLVVGKSGAKIREMEEKTGCRVTSEAHRRGGVMILQGTREQVEAMGLLLRKAVHAICVRDRLELRELKVLREYTVERQGGDVAPAVEQRSAAQDEVPAWFTSEVDTLEETPTALLSPWGFALREKSEEQQTCAIEIVVPHSAWQELVELQSTHKLCRGCGDTKLNVGPTFDWSSGERGVSVSVSGNASDVNTVLTRVRASEDETEGQDIASAAQQDSANTSVHSTRIAIPHSKSIMPLVVGTDGSSLQQICSATGLTRIFMHRFAGGRPTGVLTLEGTSRALDWARDWLSSTVARACRQDGLEQREITVLEREHDDASPDETKMADQIFVNDNTYAASARLGILNQGTMRRYVTGKGGATLREIEKETGCHIQLLGRDSDMLVYGSRKAVGAGIQTLRQTVRRGCVKDGVESLGLSVSWPHEVSPARETKYVAHLQIPRTEVLLGYVIGFQGKNLLEIRQQTQCNISVRKQGNRQASGRLVLRGSREAVQSAKGKLQEIVFSGCEEKGIAREEGRINILREGWSRPAAEDNAAPTVDASTPHDDANLSQRARIRGSYSAVIAIPPHHDVIIPQLLGAQGTRIAEVMAQTGCDHLHLERRDGKYTGRLHLGGTEDQVRSAIRTVDELVRGFCRKGGLGGLGIGVLEEGPEHGFAGTEQASDTSTTTLKANAEASVPNSDQRASLQAVVHNSSLGWKDAGKSMGAGQPDMTGAAPGVHESSADPVASLATKKTNEQTVDRSDKNTSSSDQIYLLNLRIPGLTHPTTDTSLYHYVLGKSKGDTGMHNRAKIMASTGVCIRAQQKSRTVKLYGAQEAVLAAKKEIVALVKERSKEVKKTHVTVEEITPLTKTDRFSKEAVELEVQQTRDYLAFLAAKAEKLAKEQNHEDNYDEEPQDGSTSEMLAERMKEILRPLTHPVAVVTSTIPATGPGDRAIDNFRGVTVSSFNTVTLSPEPTISFNLKIPSRSWDAISRCEKMCVHLLAASAKGAAVAHAFTQPYERPSEPFRRLQEMGAKYRGDWRRPPSLHWADAVLARIRAKLDTKKCVEVGDHVLVVAHVSRVEQLSEDDGMDALAYARRGYRALGAELRPMEVSDVAAGELSAANVEVASDVPDEAVALQEWTNDLGVEELSIAGLAKVHAESADDIPIQAEAEALETADTAMALSEDYDDLAISQPTEDEPPQNYNADKFMENYFEQTSAEEDAEDEHSEITYDGTAEAALPNESLQSDLSTDESPSPTSGSATQEAAVPSSAEGLDQGSPASEPTQRAISECSPPLNTNMSASQAPPVARFAGPRSGSPYAWGVPPAKASFSTFARSTTLQNVGRRLYSTSPDSQKNNIESPTDETDGAASATNETTDSHVVDPTLLSSTVQDFLGLPNVWVPPPRIKLLKRLQREAFFASRDLERAMADGSIIAEESARLESIVSRNERRVAKTLAHRSADDLGRMLDTGRVDFRRTQWLETSIEKGQAVLLEEAKRLKHYYETKAITSDQFQRAKEKLETDYQHLTTETMRLKQMVDEDGDAGDSRGGGGFDGFSGNV